MASCACESLHMHMLCSIVLVLGLALLASARQQPPQPALDVAEVCKTPSPDLEPFVDPLPLPTYIDVSNGQPLTIGAYKITQKLHRDLPQTTLYTYGTSQETTSFPGPTLMARRHVSSQIRWENHILDEEHMLPRVTYTVPWANPSKGGVPTVVHLHGAEVQSIYDGHPNAWFTWKNETGEAFVTQDYVYPNHQPATLLWYHDHTFGIARLNILAGLCGTYLIREDEEEQLIGTHGLPLVIKDWRFHPNGSINLPGPINVTADEWCAEQFDTLLVNGKAWPYVHVYPKPYRFRLLNACNSRILGLQLSNENLTFVQIGTDGGLLEEPMTLSTIVLSASQRADVIVDFSKISYGEEVILTNAATIEERRQLPTINNTKLLIFMKFIIVPEEGLVQGMIQDTHVMHNLPVLLSSLTRSKAISYHNQRNRLNLDLRGVLDRQLVITDHQRETGQVYKDTFYNYSFEDPVTEVVEVGSKEIWEIINPSRNVHTFHIHLIQFQVINQQDIDIDKYWEGNCSFSTPYPDVGTCFAKPPEVPSSYHQGWKDTVLIWKPTILRVLLQFTTREGHPVSFDPTIGPGYVYHCHTTQHEDHSLMRPVLLSYEKLDA